MLTQQDIASIVATAVAQALIAAGIGQPVAPVKARKAAYASAVQTVAPTVQTVQTGWMPRQPGVKHVAKYTYGRAPLGPSFPATHQLRVAALELAIGNGFAKLANVFSVGKDAGGKLTRDFNCMIGQPWTWVELSQTQARDEALKAKLAQCGYGFSPGNAMWACDSAGRPSHRTAHSRCLKAGRTMVNDD